MKRYMLILMLVLAAGCTPDYRTNATRIARRFDLPSTQAYEAREIISKTGARLIKFASSITTGDHRNDTVWGELYARSKPTAGAVVMLPGLGGGLIYERTLATSLAERGYAVYLMYLPHTFMRAPAGSHAERLGAVLSTDMKHNKRVMIQTIRDARRAANMLTGRYPQLAGRVGLVGISFGGVLGSIAYGSDKTFKAAVLCLTGGHLADTILSDALLMQPLKKAFLQAGYTPKRLREELADMEPLYYADAGKTSGLLLVAGRHDKTASQMAVKSLSRAYGGSRISWLQGNHLQALSRLISKIDLMDAHLRLRLSAD